MDDNWDDPVVRTLVTYVDPGGTVQISLCNVHAYYRGTNYVYFAGNAT